MLNYVFLAPEKYIEDWDIVHCLIADFTHAVDAEEPVGITVWGYGGRVSYGYTGGVDLETINPIIIE